MKREVQVDEEKTTVAATEAPQPLGAHRSNKKASRGEDSPKTTKFRVKNKNKVDGKGIAKERNDSGAYMNRRLVSKNKIKVRAEDISDDVSE